MIYVIAEAGVNHNGDIEKAKDLIRVAYESGADAVKFQSFIAKEEVSSLAEKAYYQKLTTDPLENQLEMLQKLELGYSQHSELLAMARHIGIEFLSSPFDIPSLTMLADLGLKKIKVPSGEITNLPYLRKLGGLGLEVILSTGMSSLGDIEFALDVLEASGTPKRQITVLHCNTEYPTPMEDVNLLAMGSIRDAFQVAVGYSDHTLGIEVPIAAAALGATVVEKHLTLSRKLPGPDHKASLEPPEFGSMVRAIRNIEQAMGKGSKRVSASEAKNRSLVRKSLVAAKPIRAGEPFTAENVTAKRPGTGISPIHWDMVMDRVAGSDFEVDEFITL